MARRHRDYKLKPTPLAKLPKAWQETIKRLRAVTAKIKKEISKEIFDTKRWIKLLSDLQSILESIAIGEPTFARYLYRQDNLLKIIHNLKKIDAMHIASIYFQCALSKNRPCDQKELQELTSKSLDTELLTGWVESLEGNRDGDGDDGGGDIGHSAEMLRLDVIGSMEFFIEEELPIIIQTLKLLYEAHQHYSVEEYFAGKVGPCNVFIRNGPFESKTRDEIDIIINMALDSLKSVLNDYESFGVPRYALEGPVVLEYGLPPIRYGGLYEIDTNLVRICLVDFEGLPLSANYDFELQEAEKTTFGWLCLLGGKLTKTLMNQQANIYTAPSYFTIAHELAHRIYYRGLRPNAREIWDLIFNSTTLPLEDREIITQYYELSRKRELLIKQVRMFKDINAPQVIMDRITNQLDDIKTQLSALDLNSELKSFITQVAASRYTVNPLTFSRRLWPTAYARINASEAFAESVIMTLWEQKEVWRKRSAEALSPEEKVVFRDLVWYFIKSLRPTKLRRL